MKQEKSKIFLEYCIYFSCCIDYQDITPVTNSVTNVRDGTTAQLTDVPDTTMPHHTYISNSTVSMLTNSDVTTHLNELPTVSTTFDDNDKRTISYPVENTHETVINRLTTDGKSSFRKQML